MRRKRRARRPTLLRRLLEEIENFVHYYQTAALRAVNEETRRAADILEKAIAERVLNLNAPARHKMHPKVREILLAYFQQRKDKQAKLEKVRYDAPFTEGENTMPKCILCGVEAEDVAQITDGFKVLGKARELVGDEEIPDVLVVSIPVKKLCPYCADVVGVKHPDEGIVEAVRYYTDLMKLAVPKLQSEVVPPSAKRQIDVDKVKEALFILQEALLGAARKKEGSEDIEAKESDMYAETPEEVAEGWKRE